MAGRAKQQRGQSDAKAKAKKKRGAHVKLTTEAQSAIVEAITKGAFDHVAASAARIAPSTFYHWMDLGSEASRGIYYDFYVAVCEARATARAKAESIVYNTDPYKWLRFGPGRDRPGSPGWTDSDATSGPITEVTQGDLTITTYWGRASETLPPRVAELESDETPALDDDSDEEEEESDALQ